MLFLKLKVWFVHSVLRVYKKAFQSFLTSTKKNYTKGVKVDLKDQVTIISTKEGAKVDHQLAVKKIIDAGYNVEAAYYNPTGTKVEQISLEIKDSKKGKHKKHGMNHKHKG
jgi:hypothetical protein